MIAPSFLNISRKNMQCASVEEKYAICKSRRKICNIQLLFVEFQSMKHCHCQEVLYHATIGSMLRIKKYFKNISC